MTAVEWLMNDLIERKLVRSETPIKSFLNASLKQAKELEEQQCQDYARFAIECDRKDLPILDFNGYNNLNK